MGVSGNPLAPRRRYRFSKQMRQSLDSMTAASRVLGAFAEKRAPDPADAEMLRSCLPLMEGLPVDELACEVIQQSMKRLRSRVHSATSVDGDR